MRSRRLRWCAGSVSCSRRAGENERLYGSVTAHEIADKLSEAVGFEVSRRRIQLEHPLRETGHPRADLRFMADVSAEFQVAVVREGETWAALRRVRLPRRRLRRRKRRLTPPLQQPRRKKAAEKSRSRGSRRE